MKPNKRILENSSILWWIFGGASSITLYFNSKIQDPFNSPKMWLLFAIGAWLLGHIASKYKDVKFNNSLKILISITLVFTILNFISALNTENLYTAFFGENQRRNGFLTYLFLVIFLIASAMFITISSIKRLNYIAFVTGLILAIYGLMQISGLDFIKWNNPYNAIISTVGNPNFAAAVMAMMSSIIFGSVLNSSFNLYYRLASAVLTLLLLFTIYLSDARQGLISIAIGIGVYVLIWLYSKKHKLRHTLFGASIIVGVLSILGMLQIGPLTSFLYKSSVTVRGYYWRAGIEMIRDNPIFGVGIDRYGAYFKEFRDVGYPLNYGFTITSTNAHNVPIQIFATSGLFTGVAYLSLLGFIAWRGIKSIRNSEGNDKLFVASIFSAWLAYQAQSIISIDNIGISIWGWVLGGAVIGLSLERNAEFSNSSKSFKNNKNLVKFNFFQASISSVSLLIVIFVIVPLYKAEKNMYETRMRYNPQVAESRSPFYDFAIKTLKTPFLEPNYKITTGSFLVANGFVDEGMKALNEVAKSDPRNLDALMYLAEFSQQMNKLNEANSFRIQIAKYDPWNAANYLQLGRNYKALGDLTNMNTMREKINSFAPNTQEASQANSELI